MEQKKDPQLPKYASEGPFTMPFTPVKRNTDHVQNPIYAISKIISMMFQNFLKHAEKLLHAMFIKSTIKQHRTDMLDESKMTAI